MPKPFSVDVLCVGYASFDLTMLVDHHPAADEKCFASAMAECGGGPAANAAVAVARLGGTSAFAGYLGDDSFGARHLAELAAEGVRTELVVRGPQATALSIILVKPGGARTVVAYKAADSGLREKEVDFSACGAGAILFDGHQTAVSLPLADAAGKSGIPTVLDAGSVHEGTVALARKVDYLVASEKFALRFSGEQDPGKALRILGRMAPFAAITMGERGILWKSGAEEGMMPAFSVDAIDTTGAGDTFHGAFALGVSRGQSMDTILEYAGAAAALCCTKAGARLGIPTHGEVERFLHARR